MGHRGGALWLAGSTVGSAGIRRGVPRRDVYTRGAIGREESTVVVLGAGPRRSTCVTKEGADREQ
jgi:hypothetical protein